MEVDRGISSRFGHFCARAASLMRFVFVIGRLPGMTACMADLGRHFQRLNLRNNFLKRLLSVPQVEIGLHVQP